jgi:hypothetical protein
MTVYGATTFAPTAFVNKTLQGILKGEYQNTIDLLFDWFGISSMTTDNFGLYLQNRLIQRGQAGGQLHADTSPLVFPEHSIRLKLVDLDAETSHLRPELGPPDPDGVRVRTPSNIEPVRKILSESVGTFRRKPFHRSGRALRRRGFVIFIRILPIL